MDEHNSKPRFFQDPGRKLTPPEIDMRDHLQMQLELCAAMYGHSVKDADMERWQADGYAARFTELTKGDPKKGIAPDQEIVALIEKEDLEAAKAKIREKLFARDQAGFDKK